MTVYVVKGNGIQVGTFQSMRDSTVRYRTPEGIQWEHIRNVFFNERNARYQLIRSLGIFRPILNGKS